MIKIKKDDIIYIKLVDFDKQNDFGMRLIHEYIRDIARQKLDTNENDPYNNTTAEKILIITDKFNEAKNTIQINNKQHKTNINIKNRVNWFYLDIHNNEGIGNYIKIIKQLPHANKKRQIFEVQNMVNHNINSYKLYNNPLYINNDKSFYLDLNCLSQVPYVKMEIIFKSDFDVATSHKIEIAKNNIDSTNLRNNQLLIQKKQNVEQILPTIFHDGNIIKATEDINQDWFPSNSHARAAKFNIEKNDVFVIHQQLDPRVYVLQFLYNAAHEDDLYSISHPEITKELEQQINIHNDRTNDIANPTEYQDTITRIKTYNNNHTDIYSQPFRLEIPANLDDLQFEQIRTDYNDVNKANDFIKYILLPDQQRDLDLFNIYNIKKAKTIYVKNIDDIDSASCNIDAEIKNGDELFVYGITEDPPYLLKVHKQSLYENITLESDYITINLATCHNYLTPNQPSYYNNGGMTRKKKRSVRIQKKRSVRIQKKRSVRIQKKRRNRHQYSRKK